MPTNKQSILSLIKVDQDSSTPLYQQIFKTLETNILNGQIPLNSLMPTEKEVTEAFGVSRITVKRAMNELALAGLVKRQRGSGTIAFTISMLMVSSTI